MTTSERRILERRLHAGWERITGALGAGQDIAPWERLWLELLGQYTATFERVEGSSSVPTETICRQCGSTFEPDTYDIRHGRWQICPECQSATPHTRCTECGRALIGTRRTLCLRCHGAAA